MYDESPSSSETALNLIHLSEVTTEEYYLAVTSTSNLNIGGSCTLSKIALNLIPLSEVNTEEYYLAVTSKSILII
eukprot:2267785-Pleurochrysis_carterae.AAC.1